MPPNKKRKLDAFTQPWQEIAKEAQDLRDGSLSRVPGAPESTEFPDELPRNSMDLFRNLLHAADCQITEMLPEGLIDSLASGTLSATHVTTAFLRRAVVAQKLTNCITELLPERALTRAKELDDYFAKHGKPIGPLHGLPISVKEMIGMNGLGLNAGYVAWWGTTADEDAHVLQILWNAGAVFFARTTQPQTMMHLETDSNLYGVTVNPYNRNVSAGGSSGGEGALIGMRGSCLGVGSDIGGSIRSPAANCGIYGFKPTAFRIPTDGWCSTAAGADAIPGVIGPMSTGLAGLKIFMQTIISSKPWLTEPALVPLPWNYEPVTTTQSLKIGVIWHDEIVTPHPPITKFLRHLVAKLGQIPNIETVDFKPHLHGEGWAILSSLYFTDGGAAEVATLAESGEPWRPLTKFILKDNPCVKKLSPDKLYYWQEEREAYRKEYAETWNKTATGKSETGELEGMVDVILCPVGPGVSPKHNTAKYWAYTAQWNLLDYPAVVFPVGKVDQRRDVWEGFEEMSELDGDNHKLYDAAEFDGLPVSLQLVGRRFEDEKVLAVLEYIQKNIQLPL